MSAIHAEALKQVFTEARTHHAWKPDAVSEATLHQLFELTQIGPTSLNMLPARIQFVTSAAAKARLIPHLMEGNVPQTQAAPVTAIIGYDREFWRDLPKNFPAFDASGMFSGDLEVARREALRNSSLQVGYFILAARALGLDAGAMSGFNKEGVDHEFWAGTTVETNVLVNIGHGDPAGLYPRGPRYTFDQAAKIV